MELKDFIENFANQFDDTDASELTPDTEFKALDEWSSLTALLRWLTRSMTSQLRVMIFATRRLLRICSMQ